MPFFPQAFFTPAVVDPAITNIFNLISDIDGYQREAAAAAAEKKGCQANCQNACQGACKDQEQQLKKQATKQARRSLASPGANFFGLSRPFNPRFDVRETETAYELHGELAGVERENISLEFTEPQTLVISGSVERNYSKASPSAAATPEAVSDSRSEHDDDSIMNDGPRTPADADEPFTEINAPRSPSPARSHRATVTDEATEDALERGQQVADEKSTAVTKAPAAPVSKPAAPAERYWFQERAVGHFKRVFSFPAPINESEVRASLDKGILSVTIPKAKREARRIAIF